MASRFFSRARADRRATTGGQLDPPEGGLIAIDTELNSPLANHRMSQRHAHRPKPLDLSISTHHVYTASVLHDAAVHSVSSASNLLAVVNDMLKSPLLAAHHKPLPPRPRSISAPPTPEIAELPGSITFLPDEPRRIPDGPKSASVTDDTMRRNRLAYQSSISTVHTAPPRTAPMDSFFPPLPQKRNSRVMTPLLSTFAVPADPSESRVTLCSQPTNPGSTTAEYTEFEDALEEPAALQPSPLIVEKNGVRRSANDLRGSAVQRRGVSMGGHVAHSSITLVGSFEGAQQIEQLRSTLTAQKHTISTLTDQFATLKDSHEAHVNSLIEAHTKEVESLKTYTHGLEQRQSTAKTLHHAPSSHLMVMLDTEQPAHKEPRTYLPSPSGQFEKDIYVSSEIQTDVPSPVLPKDRPRRSKEEEQVRREYSKLKRKIETANEQTVSIMSQLENARRQENAYRNEVQALEGRLDEANAARVDALEAAYNYEAEIKVLHQRQRSLIKENEELRVEAVHAQTHDLAGKLQDAEDRGKALEAQLKAANEKKPENDAISAFIRQIEDLHIKLQQEQDDKYRIQKEKETLRHDLDDIEHRLTEIAKINARLTKDATNDEMNKIKEENTDLRVKCARRDDAIARVQVSAEEYYRLLKAEIRKKACQRRECIENGHIISGSLTSSQASTRDTERISQKQQSDTQAKAISVLGLNEKPEDLLNQYRMLQKENEFHIQDVVACRIALREHEKEARKFSMRLHKRDQLLKQMSQSHKPTPIATRKVERPESTMTAISRNRRGSSSASDSPNTPQTFMSTPKTPHTAVTTPMSARTDGSVPVLSPSMTLSKTNPTLFHKKLPRPPTASPPETPAADRVGNQPSGLGISSHVSASMKSRPAPAVMQVAPPQQETAPMRSKRSMSESVLWFKSSQPSDVPPANAAKTPPQGAQRRPSLPAWNEVDSPDTSTDALLQSRKAAVRANVLARAEAESQSPSPSKHLTLRLSRSKPSLSSNTSTKRVKKPSSPPVFSLRGIDHQAHPGLNPFFGQFVKETHL